MAKGGGARSARGLGPWLVDVLPEDGLVPGTGHGRVRDAGGAPGNHFSREMIPGASWRHPRGGRCTAGIATGAGRGVAGLDRSRRFPSPGVRPHGEFAWNREHALQASSRLLEQEPTQGRRDLAIHQAPRPPRKDPALLDHSLHIRPQKPRTRSRPRGAQVVRMSSRPGSTSWWTG